MIKDQAPQKADGSDNVKNDAVEAIILSGKSLVIAGLNIDTATHTISKQGNEIRLEPRAVDLLVYLAERQGQVVSREELESQIWRDMVVGYDALNSTVAKIRKAFGDDPKNPTIIQTVPKAGYRFIAEVGVIESNTGAVTTIEGKSPAAKNASLISWKVITIGLIFMLVIGLLTWFKPWMEEKFPQRPMEPSLVVLPLKNLSGPDQNALAVAISEGITSGLSRFSDLFVISSDSANAYKEGDFTPQQISKELGIRFLLTGNMQRSENRLRINMQLVDADSQSAVWAESYDRIVNDLFQIQDEIVQQVTTTLGEEIWQSASKKLDEKPIGDFASVDYLLQAMGVFHELTRESTHRSRELLEKSIDLDPEQGRPYLMMAWTYYLEFKAQWQDTDPVALDRALQYVALSEEKMGRTYETHRLLAKINQVSGKFDEALMHSKEALALNPNDGDLLATYAQMLTRAGRSEEAINWIKEAMRRNPHYPPWYAAVLAIAEYLIGEYQHAVDVLNKSGNLPVWGLRYLIAGYGQLGELDKAKDPILKLLQQSPDFTVSSFGAKVAFRLESDKQHFLDGLIKAGLPE